MNPLCPCVARLFLDCPCNDGEDERIGWNDPFDYFLGAGAAGSADAAFFLTAAARCRTAMPS